MAVWMMLLRSCNSKRGTVVRTASVSMEATTLEEEDDEDGDLVAVTSRLRTWRRGWYRQGTWEGEPRWR